MMAADKPQGSAGPGPDSDSGIGRLLAIMRRLRDPEGGCPWDIEQDFKSIAPYTIEEAYEVADAIGREDWAELKSELGDLLLQAVYHSQIASERGLFEFGDIVAGICRKMIDRHPHVFGDAAAPTVSEQNENWERAKEIERGGAAGTGSALDGVPLALPALTRAQKLQKRAARAGFDWPDTGGVIGKISEEAEELAREIDAGSASGVFEEFGDLLFTLVNFSRHAGIDPESALRHANDKFHRRYTAMENRMRHDGFAVEGSDPETLDFYWELTKAEQ